jgi:hypothetical protein
MKSKIKEVNWYELIYKATEINTACKNFTDNFMGICKLCIPSPKKITREDDKIWFDSSLRTAIRLRDRLRRLYLKNKSVHNHSKFKNQRNKVNNMKKYAKEKLYTKKMKI